jgi:hypothetical protein
MTMPAQSRRKAALTFIFVTVLIDMLAWRTAQPREVPAAGEPA